MNQNSLADNTWFQNEDVSQMVSLEEAAHRLCTRFNKSSQISRRETVRLLALLFGEYSKDAVILAPLHAQYGAYTRIGKGVLILKNCCLQDEGGITIKDRTFIGANCMMNTTSQIHKNTTLAKVSPILIEEDVWIGQDVTILSGVTIGKGSIIGAGSLVDRDIPAGVIAMGNPCRIITNAHQ